ncbi:MAG: hypothetical protein JWP55_1917 [Mycobacterium sp.]|jgi:hypothetical protein|nr:hypothetical protein [Mycobacterium sp.]
MTSAESVWDVVVDEDTAIVKKTEVEARQVFAEAVTNASRLGYRSVLLRRDGAVVQNWP